MVLLRKVIGDSLRARRLAQHRTLRDVSTAANVSLGYLSEIERGHKEASSELLASICEALGAPLSQMLGDASATFALVEQMEEAFATAETAPSEHRRPAVPEPAALAAHEPAVLADDEADDDVVFEPADALAVTDGAFTVRVHSDGPLRTRLTARRTPPQRHPEPVAVG